MVMNFKVPYDISEEGIFIYGFRYCLGRKTYVVSDMVDILINNWKYLTENTKNLIKKEIKEAIDEGNAGMDMDVIQWRRILTYNKNIRMSIS